MYFYNPDPGPLSTDCFGQMLMGAAQAGNTYRAGTVLRSGQARWPAALCLRQTEAGLCVCVCGQVSWLHCNLECNMRAELVTASPTGIRPLY